MRPRPWMWRLLVLVKTATWPLTIHLQILKTEEPYIKVKLDLECRNQQFGEGWFPSLDQVPETAISMSVNQILKSENIICSVPDKRKAKAVKEGSGKGEFLQRSLHLC